MGPIEVKTKFHDKGRLDFSVTFRSKNWKEREMLYRLAKVLSEGATEISITSTEREYQVTAHKLL